MAQKRYKLIIWFYLKNHHKYKTIHVAHDMEVELTRKVDIAKWVDETDESIAKAYLIDRVKDTRETIIKRTIDLTIY
jgi:hypothetical protein|nr:MAG: hypothetical protein [Bacteriophage sp.]